MWINAQQIRSLGANCNIDSHFFKDCLDIYPKWWFRTIRLEVYNHTDVTASKRYHTAIHLKRCHRCVQGCLFRAGTNCSILITAKPSTVSPSWAVRNHRKINGNERIRYKMKSKTSRPRQICQPALASRLGILGTYSFNLTGIPNKNDTQLSANSHPIVVNSLSFFRGRLVQTM